MGNRAAVLLVAVSLIMAGCSREALQRTGYETLQNIEQQRCERDLSAECAPRESYHGYQSERQELRQSE